MAIYFFWTVSERTINRNPKDVQIKYSNTRTKGLLILQITVFISLDRKKWNIFGGGFGQIVKAPVEMPTFSVRGREFQLYSQIQLLAASDPEQQATAQVVYSWHPYVWKLKWVPGSWLQVWEVQREWARGRSNCSFSYSLR